MLPSTQTVLLTYSPPACTLRAAELVVPAEVTSAVLRMSTVPVCTVLPFTPSVPSMYVLPEAAAIVTLPLLTLTFPATDNVPFRVELPPTYNVPVSVLLARTTKSLAKVPVLPTNNVLVSVLIPVTFKSLFRVAVLATLKVLLSVVAPPTHSVPVSVLIPKTDKLLFNCVGPHMVAVLATAMFWANEAPLATFSAPAVMLVVVVTTLVPWTTSPEDTIKSLVIAVSATLFSPSLNR